MGGGVVQMEDRESQPWREETYIWRNQQGGGGLVLLDIVLFVRSQLPGNPYKKGRHNLASTSPLPQTNAI